MKKPNYRNKKGELKAPLHELYKEFLAWKATLIKSWVLHREYLETCGVWRWIEYPIYQAQIDLFSISGIGLMGGEKQFSTQDSFWFASKKECMRAKEIYNKHES